MPLIHALLTPGAFDADARRRLVRGLTDAALRAESVADAPGPRSRAIVLLQELPEDGAFSDGRPAGGLVRGVFATLRASAGVLDGARLAGLASDVQAAAEAALAGTPEPAPGRPVVTSLVFDEVPEGRWCQGGRVVRLPEMTAASRFEHLVPALLERAPDR